MKEIVVVSPVKKPEDIEVFPLSAASDPDFSEIKEKIRYLVDEVKRKDREAELRRTF